MARLIDADALKQERVYIDDILVVTEHDIEDAPTIDAIPVEWLRSQIKNNPNDIESVYDDIRISELIEKWKKEQELKR